MKPAYLNRKSKNYWNMKKKPEIWWASYKKDGVFCHIERGSGCVSREGNLFPGMEHIAREVDLLFKQNRNITYIQGELYTDMYPFQTLQGICKKGEDSRKRDISLHVFTLGGLGDPTKYIEKFVGEGYNHLLPVSRFWTITDGQVPEAVRSAITEGYEGLVLRRMKDDGVIYKAKTTAFYEMDLTISGWEEGKGHLIGHLGKFHCVGMTDDKKRVLVKIGGGAFKKNEGRDSRLDIWQRILAGENFLGRKLEAKHEGLTQAKGKDFWSLRFGKFVKMKEDR